MQIDILAQIAEQKNSLVKQIDKALKFEESYGYAAVGTDKLFSDLRLLEHTVENLQELYAGEVQQLRWC